MENSVEGDIATEYVFDRIDGYDKDGGLFRVRWEGHSAKDDTWERPDHLPRNAVAQFFRRRKRNPPASVLKRCQ